MRLWGDIHGQNFSFFCLGWKNATWRVKKESEFPNKKKIEWKENGVSQARTKGKAKTLDHWSSKQSEVVNDIIHTTGLL